MQAKKEKKNANTIKTAIAIIGGVTFIGGASIFGGVSLFQSLFNELKLVIPDNGKSETVSFVTPIPNAATEPIPSQTPAEPTIVSTETPISHSDGKINITRLKDAATTIQLNQSQSVADEDVTIKKDSFDNTYEFTDNNVVGADNSEEPVSEEDSSNEAQTEQNEDGKDISELSSTQTLSIDSPGQLLFFSNNISEEGTLTMYYNSNVSSDVQIETDDITRQNNGVIYNINDLVNDLPDDGAEQENIGTISYINVKPGTYSIIYDISIEMEIYLVGNVDDYFFEEQENDSQESEKEEEVAVPHNDIKEVVFTEEQVYTENIVSQYTFYPTIYFSSYEQIDGVLEIIDEYGNGVLSINASELGETHEFTCEFELQKGMKYTIIISSGEYDFTTEPTYYYKIFDLQTKE